MNNLDQLTEQVRRLADAAHRQTSLGRRFLSGLIFGIGTAIGASAIGAAALYLLLEAVRNIDFEKLINFPALFR